MVIVRLLLLALLIAGVGTVGSAPAPLDVTADSQELPGPAAGDDPAIAAVDADAPAPVRAQPRWDHDRSRLPDPVRAGVFRPPRG